MLFPEGKLVKMEITPYADKGFQNKVGNTTKVLINPESLKESYKINYVEDQPKNSEGKEQQFNHIKAGEFNIKLLLDSTGVFDKIGNLKQEFKEQVSNLIPDEFNDVENDESIGISEQVNKLKTFLFKKNAETHEPNYIRLAWAGFQIDCKITNVVIDYKLFNPNGYPIRAVVDLTCLETISNVLRKAEISESSPDMTHIREVKQGDTLPLMTHRIYGDSKYYLEVAKANKLLNFRNLLPGQKIFFPPLDKALNV